jgi:hypothetical protein
LLLRLAMLQLLRLSNAKVWGNESHGGDLYDELAPYLRLSLGSLPMGSPGAWFGGVNAQRLHASIVAGVVVRLASHVDDLAKDVQRSHVSRCLPCMGKPITNLKPISRTPSGHLTCNRCEALGFHTSYVKVACE